MRKLEGIIVFLLLVAVSIIAVSGINHAGDNMLVGIISPVILVLSIILGVFILVNKFSLPVSSR